MRPTRSFPSRLAAALVIAASLAACAPDGATAPTAAAAPARAARGALPDRFIVPGATTFPEGVAYSERSGYVYVSSTGDGTVFRGTAADETLAPFLAPGADGRTTSVGLEVDGAGRLYVAGGATGRVWVYDGESGALLAALVASPGQPTFINDIAIAAGDTAYVTDSQRPVIYRVTPGADGGFTLTEWLNLTGTAASYGPGFNLNGIVAGPDGRTLYTVKSNSGELFRIDTRTREVARVDVGGATFPNGDGLEIRGTTLYVLQNAQETIAEVRVQPNAARGTLVSTSTDASFAYPTSLAIARGRLLVVNAQFDRRPTGNPVLPFTVSVVKVP